MRKRLCDTESTGVAIRAWFILVAEKWKVICLLIVTIFSVVIQCRYEVRRFDRLIPPSACRSASCPPARNYNMRGLLCSYSCPDAERYVCVENGEGNEVTEFCAPSLECEAGYMGVFTIDNKDSTKIVMTVEPCPPDSYQQYSSNCIHACTSKRDDFTFLTNQFVIYSYGSTVQAPEVYCNYILGFYSPDNIMLFVFDDEFQFNFGGYCEHVSEKDPCEKGLMPLPNGTCVVPCLPGHIRDDHDDFICKPQTNKSSILIDTVGMIQSTIGPTMTTEIERGEITGITHHSRSNDWIIAFSVLAVIVIVLVIILVCYCKRNKHKNEQKDANPNGNIEEGIPMQDVDPEADESDNGLDVLKEQESLLEKEEELPQQNGNHKQTVEVNLEEEHLKPAKKEYDSKGRKNELMKNIQHIESIENNYKANNIHLHIYNGPTQAVAADAMKEVENVAEGHAGELKKKHDDTLTADKWDALNTQKESVGCLIAHGNSCGTVFRVGKYYVMTAFHIIYGIVRRGNGQAEEGHFDLSLLTHDEIYVNFNTSVTDKPRIVSKLTCIFYDRSLDVAVLKFDIISDLTREMVLDKYGCLNPETVNIIGYGNPKNLLKKHIDPSCEVIPANSVKIRDALLWLSRNVQFYRGKVRNPNLVDAGYYGYDDRHKIILSCYLEHGASGAPLLDVDNNRCVVVGLLTNGMPEFYFHLLPEDQRTFPTEYRFEYGTRMKDIHNAIQESNPELAKDIFGEHFIINM